MEKVNFSFYRCQVILFVSSSHFFSLVKHTMEFKIRQKERIFPNGTVQDFSRREQMKEEKVSPP